MDEPAKKISWADVIDEPIPTKEIYVPPQLRKRKEDKNKPSVNTKKNGSV
jgi:hypothetical protein